MWMIGWVSAWVTVHDWMGQRMGDCVHDWMGNYVHDCMGKHIGDYMHDGMGDCA